MKVSLKYNVLTLVAIIFVATAGFSQNKYKNTEASSVTKLLGKDSIYSNKPLTENLAGIDDFSKFTKAVKLTGLETELQKEQMYTAFVPENSAFSHFSKKELDSLFSSENAGQLKEILLHHVVPGRVDKNAIEKAIELNGGAASFATLNGQSITFRKEGKDIVFTAADGTKGRLLNTNYRHSRGFFHTVNGLALPKS